jgi:SET domain-containing protein
MKRLTDLPSSANPEVASIVVRHSSVHGNGVFAKRKIAAETCIIEYAGERITARQAVKRSGTDPDNPCHTFFFSLETGRLIDGASQGNDARWINHSCAPNCEAREEDGRVYIYALRDIRRGEELNYDYGLIISERHTPAVKRAYACLCGASTCRQTMLAPKRKARRETK